MCSCRDEKDDAASIGRRKIPTVTKIPKATEYFAVTTFKIIGTKQK